MKRSFFWSTLLHAAFILLLFSWETPLADKFMPRTVIVVSLVERIEEKERPQVHSPVLPQPKKAKTLKKKESPPAPPIKDQKGEMKEEKIKLDPGAPKEARPKVEEKAPLEIGSSLTPAAQPSEFPTGTMSQTQESGKEGKALLGDSMGREFTSGSIYVALPNYKGAGGEAGLEGGRQKSGPSGGREAPLQVGKVQPSPTTEIDPILSLIITKIEAAKRYPRAARKMGIEGKTAVRFKLNSDGRVEAIELVESSGSEILDKASLETVQRAAPLPYKEGWLKVVIVFKIL